jgi:hypothetical protein
MARKPSNRPAAYDHVFDATLIVNLFATKHEAAEVLGLSRVTLNKYLDEGLDPFRADDCAILVGSHPALVWGDAWTEMLEGAES